MSTRRITETFFLAFILTCCQSAPEENIDYELQKTIETYTVQLKGDVNEIDKHVKSVSFIPISKEIAGSIGWVRDFFVVDEEFIILIDNITDQILKIDLEGNLVWTIKGRRDDFRYFEEIHECTYNPYEKEILAYDPPLKKLFVYNLDGEFKRTELISNFHQLYQVTDEDRLYSMQGLVNSIEFSGIKPQQLIWERNDSLRAMFIDQVYHAPAYTFFIGFSEFDQLNGKAHYHATFKDTFYLIDLPRVTPDFTLKFAGKTKTIGQYTSDPTISNKVIYANENGIPVIYHAASDGNKMALTYKLGAKRFAALYDIEHKKWSFNAQLLKYNGRVFQAPRMYDNGYYLRPMYQYEMEYLKNVTPEEVSTGAYLEQLDQLRQKMGEDNEIVLCLVKI